MPYYFKDERGNEWEGKDETDPNPVLVHWADQPQQMPPADPAFQYEGPRAAADLARTQAATQKTQVDASVAAQTAPADIRLAEAQARKAEAEAQKLTSGREMTAASRADAIRGFKSSMALSQTIAALEERYRAGPGATSGVMGFQDYLPLERNERFDRAANASRGTVADVLGFTGGQLNSVGEAQMNVGPFIPQSGDKDGTILDSIQRLKDLQTQGIERSVAILGGIPDASGNILPVPENEPLNAMTINRMIPGAPAGAAGFGAETKTTPIPQEMQQENAAFLDQWDGDPDKYVAFRSQLDDKYGFVGDPAAYRGWATQTAEKLQEGGYTLNPTIGGVEEKMTGTEQFRNNLANNPLGAGAIGFADSVGMGGVRALAPEQFNALSDDRPLATGVGQVGGAILGTGMIGKAGATAAGKIAPNLLGGGSKAQFGRDLATDVAYGAGYGAVTEGDPLTGAALAGVGSAGGQLVGKGIGSAVGGANISEAVKALKARGIPLTTGQTLGGTLQRVEDKAVSIPLIGDMIRKRRLEGLDEFNTQAFQEAGAPIGFTPSATGKQGLQQLDDATSAAYTDTLSGVQVPFDDTTLADLAAATKRAGALPKDRRRSLDEIIDYRVQPLEDAGSMTGDSYQQALRGLKKARSKPPEKFAGFEDAYKDSVTDVIGALDSTMMRGGGADVVEGLNAANAATRNMKTLEDAATRGAGGSQTDEIFTFTPSQLQRAGIATQRKFPGARPFEDLADAGQQVLPSSVPNTASADRLAQMALLPGAGLVGAGSGAGYALGGTEGIDDGAKVSAGLAALLALGGTKGGQAAINKVIAERPEMIRQIGTEIRKRKGLFGSAAVPLAIGSQY